MVHLQTPLPNIGADGMTIINLRQMILVLITIWGITWSKVIQQLKNTFLQCSTIMNCIPWTWIVRTHQTLLNDAFVHTLNKWDVVNWYICEQTNLHKASEMAKQKESSKATTQHIMALSNTDVNTFHHKQVDVPNPKKGKKGKKGKTHKTINQTRITNQDKNAQTMISRTMVMNVRNSGEDTRVRDTINKATIKTTTRSQWLQSQLKPHLEHSYSHQIPQNGLKIMKVLLTYFDDKTL